MSLLKEKLKEGKFVITCESGPPKGVEVKETLKSLKEIRNLIDAFNVTDLQSSVMKLGSLAFSYLVQEQGQEV